MKPPGRSDTMPPPPSPSTEELLQAGFRYACALTHHRQDAEDLVHTAWLKLYQRYGAVASKPLFFSAIRNLYIDQYRRRQRLPFTTLNGELALSPAVNASTAGDAGVTLKQLLAKLRDIEREALFLHVVEGYSAGEIAALTGRPRGSVLSLIHRGRQKLAALAATESRTS